VANFTTRQEKKENESQQKIDMVDEENQPNPQSI